MLQVSVCFWDDLVIFDSGLYLVESTSKARKHHLRSSKWKFVSLAWMIQTFPACTHVKQNPPAMLPPNPIYFFSCSAVLELQLAPAVATAGPREHPPASAALGEISLGSLHSKDFFHPFLKAQCDWRIQIRLQMHLSLGLGTCSQSLFYRPRLKIPPVTDRNWIRLCT